MVLSDDESPLPGIVRRTIEKGKKRARARAREMKKERRKEKENSRTFE